MKSRFTFIKNIILIVASALTLVTVTFAWFSTDRQGTAGSVSVPVGAEKVKVVFYQQNSRGTYEPLSGDINLDNISSGEYKKYRIVIETFTRDGIDISLNISGLPSDISPALKSSVCTKYSLHKANLVNNSVVDGDEIAHSNGYVPLATTGNGNLLGAPVSLANYQNSEHNYFVIYYEIGLSENADSGLSGLRASLGTLSVVAQ